MTDETRIWNTYAEASAHAKRIALTTQKSVTLVSVANGWVISRPNPPTIQGKPKHATTSEFKPDARLWEPPDIRHTREEKECAEARNQGIAADFAEERGRRQGHLENLRRHYMSLTELELDALWAAREATNLDPHETDLLRSVLRHIKGITPGLIRDTYWQQHQTTSEWDFT